MPKQIPILFSTPMVQAILAGRKTETRRIVKPQPIDNREVDGNFFEGNHKGYVKVDGHSNWQEQFACEFAQWQPGDVLYVREKYYQFGVWLSPSKNKYCFEPQNWNVKFQESEPEEVLKICQKNKENGAVGWYTRLGRFMPKRAARIWLEVVSVGVERLQDISEESAKAEGIYAKPGSVSGRTWYEKFISNSDARLYGAFTESAKECFQTLWQSINGPESWEANPWVWVVKFKVLSTTGKPATI